MGISFDNKLKIPIQLTNLQLMGTFSLEDGATNSNFSLKTSEETVNLKAKTTSSNHHMLSISVKGIDVGIRNLVKNIKITGYRYAIFGIPIIVLFKDLRIARKNLGGVNFDSLIIPVTSNIAPLLGKIIIK